MKDSAKYVTKACLWFALLTTCARLQAELKPEDLYATALPSMMTLEVENAAGEHFVGSAFLALQPGVAITAWHVVHDAVRVEACFADHERVPVLGLLDKDEVHDLALLKLASTSRPRATLSRAVPRIGSRVYVIGAPKGFDFSIADGLISQIRSVDGIRYCQVSCPISPGDSGGPVLNDAGQVVGIVSWRKANAQGVSFAIPATAVAGLNANGPVRFWPRSTLVAHPSEGESGTTALVRANADGSKPLADDGFTQFQKLLHSHAGQRLTVIVKETGQENRFTFTVPQHATP